MFKREELSLLKFETAGDVLVITFGTACSVFAMVFETEVFS